MQATRYSVRVVAEPTGFWGVSPVPADGLPGLGLVSFPVKLRKAECWQGLQLPLPAASPELGLGSGHPPRSGSCVSGWPATVSGGLVSPESPCPLRPLQSSSPASYQGQSPSPASTATPFLFLELWTGGALSDRTAARALLSLGRALWLRPHSPESLQQEHSCPSWVTGNDG